MNHSEKVAVFYDGACHLCSREIEHYRKKDTREAFSFVDISLPSFQAVELGLDPIQVQKVMHVRAPSGELKTGVDAFIEIWNHLPGFEPLARLATKAYVRPFLDLGYHAFARIRPFLPKKKAHCDSGTCHV